MDEQQAFGFSSGLGELRKEFGFSFFKGLFLNGENYFSEANVQTILLTILSVWQITKMA